MQDQKKIFIEIGAVALVLIISAYFFGVYQEKSRVAKESEKNIEPEVTVSDQKTFSSEFANFSYKNTAGVLYNRSDDILKVGTDLDDPFLEVIVKYPDTRESDPFKQGGNYIKGQSVTYGNNTFEVYSATESGSKIFVLRKGTQAISVIVPFRQGGNDTTMYVDLASISF